MVFSVFTRHSPDCKFKRDRLCRRCSCPKWVGGQVNKEYFRQSAATRIWDEAEQLRDKLEEALLKGLPPFGPQPKSALLPAPAESGFLPTTLSPAAVSTAQPQRTIDEDASRLPPPAAPAPAVSAPPTPSAEFLPPNRQKARVTVQKAVAAYMTDARSRGLKSDTIKKLERIFEKQFLPWTKTQGLEYLDEIDLDALLSFRSTWTEGPSSGRRSRTASSASFGTASAATTSPRIPLCRSAKSRPPRFPPIISRATSSIGSSLPPKFMATLAAALFRSRTPVPDCVL